MNEELVNIWIDYLQEYERDAIGEALQQYPNDTQGITLDMQQLRRKNPDLADDLVAYPGRVIDAAEKAIPQLDIPHAEGLDGISVRVSSLPNRELGLSEVRERFQGELITVRAQVSKATDIRPKYDEVAFQCRRCPTITTVPAVAGEIAAPTKCDGCERQGPFTINESESSMYDHQIVELQPRPDEDAMNLQRSLIIHLKDDLVDCVSAGDRVKATGILKTEDVASGKKVDARRPQFIEGLSLEREQQDFESYNTDRVDEIEELAERDDLEEQLVASFAQDILTGDRGDTHKLAVIYQMFGGVRHKLPNGDEKRGDINILLIGAPGTGKSAYLNAANKLSPKSIKASGKGATAAGLTATATQPEFGDGWMLDAGALVMASGGLACIDEFDKMQESARKSMHEAMEDQEIPINKAGINTTLTSKTAVLAAANPIGGRFNRFDALSEQINLGEALITRFDLVFALDDTPNKDKDREIAKHQYNVTKDGTVEPAIEADLLREYIAYARQNVRPSFDDPEAVDILVDKYVDIRQENGEDDDAAVPVTARMNESLRRLAEAAARSELCETVKPRHAEKAIELYSMTIGDIGLTEEGNISAAKAAGHPSKTQQERIEAISKAIQEEAKTPEEIAEETGVDVSKVEHRLKKFKDSGDVYEPSNDGAYKAV